MIVLSVLMENLDVPQIVLTTVENGLAMEHVNKYVGPTFKRAIVRYKYIMPMLLYKLYFLPNHAKKALKHLLPGID